MSELDLLSWSCVFSIPQTWVYNFILVNQGIVELSCVVVNPGTTARPSVKAAWLLTASMSSVVFFITETQNSSVISHKLVSHLHGTCGGAIMMVVRQISVSLSGSEGCWVDMRVAEWIWLSLSWYDSYQVNTECSQYIDEDSTHCILTGTRCALTDAQWLTTPMTIVIMLGMCKSIQLWRRPRLKWNVSGVAIW